MKTDPGGKPLVWLHGEVRSPPFSKAARIRIGDLLRRLQNGETLPFPHSRPMPSIGARCHELRIVDEDRSWRVAYRTDVDAVVVAAVFPKTSRTTPAHIIKNCQHRLRRYDELTRGGTRGERKA
jgi:phage-related protein